MAVERRWSVPTKRIVLGLIALSAILVVWRAWSIVPPFLWAFVVGYALLPAVSFLERRGLGRGPAAAVVFVLLAAGIAGAIRLAAPVAIAQIHEVQHAFPTTVRNAQQAGAAIMRDLGMGDLTGVLFPLGTSAVSTRIAQMVVPLAAALGRLAVDLLIFLIAVFFVLRDAPRLFDLVGELVPAQQRAETTHLGEQISALIARYIRAQLLLVLLMATVTSIGLSILEVPYSVLLGMATGVLELIPIAGPITAGALAVAVALGHTNPFGWTQLWYAATVAIMYTVLRQTEDYLVVPLVIGRIVRLRPVVVIFSVLAGGAMLGLLGVILAVPVAATVRLLLIYVVARMRDEDPLAQLTKEVAAAGEGRGRVPASEAHAVPGGARS